MPELPEVERAAALLRTISEGKQIIRVEVVEDNIVYSGTSHTEFAAALTGRTVKAVGRYGKVFYMELEGEGKMPVMHFGMTGMLQVKGQLPTYYRETPRTASTDWPPRFMRFILHIKDPSTSEVTQVAFLDARRLGRIRLCASPLKEEPISALGFDPILSMPRVEDFKKSVLRRGCPIKSLLLDQSFSAGVGNWVADEILYHAHIHPERRCNTLTDNELSTLHQKTRYVCEFAVSVNADDSKFPDDWLFQHRWGKGKKKHTLLLASGESATIKWITVGGRTSAFVAELQRLGNETGGRKKRSRKRATGGREEAGPGSESELTSLEDGEHDIPDQLGPSEQKDLKPVKTGRTTSQTVAMVVTSVKQENVRPSKRRKT